MPPKKKLYGMRQVGTQERADCVAARARISELFRNSFATLSQLVSQPYRNSFASATWRLRGGPPIVIETYTCKRPTRVIYIYIYIYFLKFQRLQILQNMNYGNYIYNKINFCFLICSNISKLFQKVELLLAFLVCFV